MIRRLLARCGLALAPFAASWLWAAPFILLHDAVRGAEAPPGLALWLLLLPPLLGEAAFTAWYEWPAAREDRWRRGTALAGLAARCLALGVQFYFLVARTALVHGTDDSFDCQIGDWPGALYLWLAATPVLAGVGLAAAAALYFELTVRRRRLRLTTTTILPLLLGYCLFELCYNFPDHPLRGAPARTPTAQLVFPVPGGGEADRAARLPLYPRDIQVSPDERRLVATFGSTFGRDTSVGFAADNENRGQPNLFWLDLKTRRGGVSYADTVRNFYSERAERVFLTPWHNSIMLELDMKTGRLSPHRLPQTLAGQPVAEANYTYYASDLDRVFILNSRNPAVISWDPGRRRMAGSTSLLAVPGVRMGDMFRSLTRNRALGRIYVGGLGRWNIISLDERTLAPLVWTRMPHEPIDFVLSPDGRFLYVAAFYHGTVWKLDAATLRLLGSFAAPLHSRRLAISMDGRVLYAAGYVSGELVAFDAGTGAEISRCYVGPKPEALFVTSRSIYVSTADGIFRLPAVAGPG